MGLYLCFCAALPVPVPRACNASPSADPERPLPTAAPACKSTNRRNPGGLSAKGQCSVQFLGREFGLSPSPPTPRNHRGIPPWIEGGMSGTQMCGQGQTSQARPGPGPLLRDPWCISLGRRGLNLGRAGWRKPGQEGAPETSPQGVLCLCLGLKKTQADPQPQPSSLSAHVLLFNPHPLQSYLSPKCLSFRPSEVSVPSTRPSCISP